MTADILDINPQELAVEAERTNAAARPTPLAKVMTLIVLGFVASIAAGVALASVFQPEGSQDAGLWVALPSVFLVLAFVLAARDSLRGWSRGRRLPSRFIWFAILAFGMAVPAVGTIVERSTGGGGSADFGEVELLVVVIGSLALSVLAWRNMDEAAREAHKAAWYWGGSLAAIPGFVLASVSADWATRLGFEEPAELIQFGALTVLVSMLVGYLIAWGVWWFGKR